MNDKPFCVAPVINLFLQMNNKNIGPCCAWNDAEAHDGDNFDKVEWQEGDPWKNTKLTQFRESMYTTTSYPKSCGHCINQEKAGIKTDKKAWDETLGWYYYEDRYNNWYDVKSELPKQEFIQHLSELKAPMAIHYQGGNMCNLKCIMCDASNSTEWQKEIEENEELHDFYSYQADWSGLDTNVLKNLE